MVFSCSFMMCWFCCVAGGAWRAFWDRGDATNRSSEVFFCTASRVFWWRSRLCSSPKVLNVHIWNQYLSMYTVYLYWHTDIYIYMLDIPCRPWKCTSKNPIHLSRPKNLIKFACFSCASDSLLSFSSSWQNLAPKSNRIVDLQANGWNPKIDGFHVDVSPFLRGVIFSGCFSC